MLVVVIVRPISVWASFLFRLRGSWASGLRLSSHSEENPALSDAVFVSVFRQKGGEALFGAPIRVAPELSPHNGHRRARAA